MKRIIRYCLLIAVTLSVAYFALQYINKKPTPAYDKDVTIPTAYALSQDPSVTIIDVRPREDVAKGHLENSVNLDVTQPEFTKGIEKLDKHATYLIYCNVGRRSAEAVQKMNKAGFTKVYHMKDGIVEWEKEGLPIE